MQLRNGVQQSDEVLRAKAQEVRLTVPDSPGSPPQTRARSSVLAHWVHLICHDLAGHLRAVNASNEFHYSFVTHVFVFRCC